MKVDRRGVNQYTKNRPSLRDRFYQKFQPVTESGCWIWTGAAGKKMQYGQMLAHGRMRLAHRVSWELHVGPLPPKGFEICHKCDVGYCVNPQHLFVGTHLENCQDRERKGRGIHPVGSNHVSAKLTEEEVRIIRTSPCASICFVEVHGLSRQAINAIRRGKGWKHVSPPKWEPLE